jgi:hypothetical protein
VKFASQPNVFRVSRPLLDETWRLLREAGRDEREATVFWLGSVADNSTVEILSAVRPGQVARRGRWGVSVEVTQEGLTELIMLLAEGVFIAVRLHTHPGDAYHSEMDDANMVISHKGAISIVVPKFASGTPDLRSCSVNELKNGVWVELDRLEVATRFEVA